MGTGIALIVNAMPGGQPIEPRRSARRRPRPGARDRTRSSDAGLRVWAWHVKHAATDLSLRALQRLTHGDALHQLGPIVLDVADLGADFPCLVARSTLGTSPPIQ